MSTNVKIYRSTDAGAAAFTLYGNVPGTTYGAGGWIGILKACLVDGYGSQTASSLTVTSNVATFNCTSHGFLAGQCVLIAGATPSDLNGEKYVTSVTVNSFTFAAPGVGDQTATGTITSKVAPAGWTEPYTAATNITCFKQGGGNGFYINLDETAVQVTRLTPFESMTAVGIANGTNAFPTTAQVSGGLYINRSSASSTAARDWIIFATDRHLYCHVNSSAAADAATSMMWALTDLKSYKSADAYATLVTGGTSATIASNSTFALMATQNTTCAGNYIARSYTGTGTSQAANKHNTDRMDTSTQMGTASFTYPYPMDGSMLMCAVRAGEPNSPRGTLPGIWNPMHSKPLSHLDTFTGTGDLAGKSFMALNLYNAGQVFIETSNTWDI